MFVRKNNFKRSDLPQLFRFFELEESYNKKRSSFVLVLIKSLILCICTYAPSIFKIEQIMKTLSRTKTIRFRRFANPEMSPSKPNCQSEKRMNYQKKGKYKISSWHSIAIVQKKSHFSIEKPLVNLQMLVFFVGNW